MNMFGTPTDPWPFIISAYTVGFAFIFGYSVWLISNHKKINRYLETLKNQNSK